MLGNYFPTKFTSDFVLLNMLLCRKPLICHMKPPSTRLTFNKASSAPSLVLTLSNHSYTPGLTLFRPIRRPPGSQNTHRPHWRSCDSGMKPCWRPAVNLAVWFLRLLVLPGAGSAVEAGGSVGLITVGDASGDGIRRGLGLSGVRTGKIVIACALGVFAGLLSMRRGLAWLPGMFSGVLGLINSIVFSPSSNGLCSVPARSNTRSIACSRT